MNTSKSNLAPCIDAGGASQKFPDNRAGKDGEFVEAAADCTLALSVLNAVSAVVLVLDDDGRLLHFNRACEGLTGFSIDEVKGRLFWEILVEANEAEGVRAVFYDPFIADTPKKHQNCCISKSGKRLLVAWSENVFIEADGDRRYVIVTGEDVTASKATEEALRWSEASLAVTLDSIGDAVIATNVDGRISRMNRVALQLTGWSFAEAEGHELAEVFKIVDFESGVSLPGPFAAAMAAEGSVSLVRNTALATRSGRRYLISDSAAAIRDRPDSSPRGMVLVFRDITEKSALDQEYQQAKKLETIGRLAGGVAHDFNNLLAGIVGYTELLAMELPTDSRLHRYSRIILETAARAATITKQLLAFSRKGKMVSLPVDMNIGIASAVGLLERAIDKRISIVTRYCADSPTVLGDPSLLESAVLNLAVNARDALPNGGTITIETKRVQLEQEFLAENAADLLPGEYLEVSVTDTGTGMSEEAKDHLYEPFYTTKEIGRGTGLGLAAVYGTVKEHHGAITFTSRLNHGTSFQIYLPICTLTPSEVSEDGLQTLSGSGCILLVDDEAFIRDSAAATLRAIGYEVLIAEDGAQALDIYRCEGYRIKVVILDVVMPTMNGPDTFLALKSLNPGIKVILSSGYPFDTGAEKLLKEGVFSFLQKPFGRKELHIAIQEGLSGSEAAKHQA